MVWLTCWQSLWTIQATQRQTGKALVASERIGLYETPWILPNPTSQYGMWLSAGRCDGLWKVFFPDTWKILLETVYPPWMRERSQRPTHRYLPNDRKAYDGKAEALMWIFNCGHYLNSNANTPILPVPQLEEALSGKDLAISLFSIDAKRLKAGSWRVICMPMFLSAIFITILSQEMEAIQGSPDRMDK